MCPTNSQPTMRTRHLPHGQESVLRMTNCFPPECPGAHVRGAEFHRGPQLCGVTTAESPAQISGPHSPAGDASPVMPLELQRSGHKTPGEGGGGSAASGHFISGKLPSANQTGSRDTPGAAAHDPLWLGRRWGTCLQSEVGLLRGDSVRKLSVCARMGISPASSRPG